MSELHVVTCVFNPGGYRSRYRLYEEFRARMKASGVTLYTIELAMGEQDFVVTREDDPHDFRLRTTHELWFKENLLNIVIGQLPSDWQYVAWVDADVAFARPDWVEATIEQLRQHPFVQMFSHIVQLGPNFQPLQAFEGFAYRYRLHGLEETDDPANPGSKSIRIGLQGYAWAARREALEAVGGLVDFAIVGSGDYYMALSLVGGFNEDFARTRGNFGAELLRWQARAEAHVRRDVGCLDTTLLHYWHGSRKDRAYETRGRILTDHQFDPAVDLRRDGRGLLELTSDKPELREAIRAYFRARNEDGVEV